MRILILCLAVLPAVFGTAVNIEKCAWGESYWCSDIKAAVACGAVNHCTTTIWKNQKLSSDPSELCQYCEVLIDDVHKFINDNKTEQDIANFLSTACNLCPDKAVSTECTALVKAYLPELLNMITSGLSPQAVCSTIHLCTGLADVAHHSEIKDTSVELVHVPLVKDVTPTNGEPICTDCKKFFSDIKDLITDPMTEKQVEDMINQQVCSWMRSYKSGCELAVKEFVPAAMTYLQSFVDPAQTCVDMQFCATSQNVPRTAPRLFDMFSYEKIGSPDSCLVCKTVMSEVQTLDRSASFQTTVKNMVKSDVCIHLASLKTECLTFVDQYAQILFELIATFMDPSTRCRSLGFCPADDLLVATARIGAEEKKIAAVPVLPLQTPVTAPSVECILCEFVMKQVYDILGNNKTEAAIISAMDKVCSYLPKTVADSCKSFVDTYGPAIITILQTEVTPDQVCSLMGLCKQSRQATTPIIPAPLKFDSKVGDAETCLICETLVQYVEAMVENNATIVQVEAVVKKICNIVPDTMKKQCGDIIDEYGPMIIQYITTKYDPKEVCTLIGVCTSVSSVRMTNLVPAVQKPGATKCSHGPAYWCASQENAERCGAVEHCQTYVWKN